MNKLVVSSTPHIRSNESVQRIMLDVIIALTPACVAGIILHNHSLNALITVAISIIACVLFEAGFQKLAKQTVTISDLSAVVTGLLLAMNLPETSPFWMPIVGAFFSIVVAKQVFGGLGQNFINPALAGRAFLLAAYPTKMTGSAAFTAPKFAASAVDAATYATPLTALKEGGNAVASSDIINGFLGNVGGTIGETCAVLLILGGIYLIARKVISWRIPVVYIATVFIFMLIFGRNSGNILGAVNELFVGGLMLGAFFMATDYASSPVTPVGQLIMGFGCGLLTSIIRLWGGYPEGVSYSILLMNLCVPLIDRFTEPKIFGEVKKK
ncbi:MAG: RnfABCDGE type electron transport complex subunit D [Clostridiales bacterium]|nr:RnfABCDGE type electron transport complex subunit D [Clostridiales bacterium]